MCAGVADGCDYSGHRGQRAKSQRKGSLSDSGSKRNSGSDGDGFSRGSGSSSATGNMNFRTRSGGVRHGCCFVSHRRRQML